jgi:hypothetical protein
MAAGKKLTEWSERIVFCRTAFHSIAEEESGSGAFLRILAKGRKSPALK